MNFLSELLFIWPIMTIRIFMAFLCCCSQGLYWQQPFVINRKINPHEYAKNWLYIYLFCELSWYKWDNVVWRAHYQKWMHFSEAAIRHSGEPFRLLHCALISENLNFVRHYPKVRGDLCEISTRYKSCSMPFLSQLGSDIWKTCII